MKHIIIILALLLGSCSDSGGGGGDEPAPAPPAEPPAPPVRINRTGQLTQAEAMQMIRSALEKQTGYRVESLVPIIKPLEVPTGGPAVFTLQGFDFALAAD